MDKPALLIVSLLIQTTTLFSQADSTKVDSIKYDYGKWGIGFDIGSGAHFTYGTAEESVKNGATINMALTFSYNKLHYSFRYLATFGKLKRTLDYGHEWEAEHSFNSLNLELSTGYQLLNKKYFNIIPTGSIGISSFFSPDKDENTPVIKTKYHFAWSVGAAFDFKLPYPMLKKIEAQHTPDELKYNEVYWFFRVNAGVYPTFYQHPFDMNGGMYFVTLSFGGYLKAAKIIKNKTAPNRRANKSGVKIVN